jgi:hypothetical protein
MMQALSQRDPRWASEKLGTSYVTVGRYGCTITCLSMLSEYYKDFKTPRNLARYLKYTKDGRVIWDSLPAVLPFKLEKRLYRRDDERIKKSLKDPNRAVIFQVDYHHWVVACGTYKFAPWIYRVADPWIGKKAALIKPFLPYRQITGSAHFIRN